MPTVQELIGRELARQRSTLTLIASENYPSPEVLSALGSVLTAKYSEGYPGKRYYGGNEVVDEIETAAQRAACQLFGAEHANVQPYSGSPANLAALLTLAEPGSTVLGMSLPSGGHLTHGYRASATGKLFRGVQYEVGEDGLLSYDAIREVAQREKPVVIIAGFTAYPRQVDFASFRQIANEVGASLLADISHISGLVATGLHPSPLPYADVTMTTTHKLLRGPRGALLLCKQERATALDRWVFPGLQGGPHDNVTAGILQALQEAATPEYRSYCSRVLANAQALASALLEAGLTLVTGGTDTHLLLVDLRPQEVSGRAVEEALGRAGIVANRNAVPRDPRPPLEASGLRLGTPALTTRGLGEAESRRLGEVITRIILQPGQGSEAAARQLVAELTKAFPLYPGQLG